MAVRTGIRKAKFKFKWTKELIFLIVGILVIVAVTIILALPTKLDKLKSRWQAASLTDETVIEEISEDKIKSLMQDGKDFFVFYATPDTDDAVTNIQTVETYANRYNFDTVYWLDATEINQMSDEDKQATDFVRELEERNHSLGDVDLLTIPSFWYYKDGVLTIDSADYEDISFEQIVFKAMGDLRVSLNQ